jgi:hypothetical protein
MRLTDNVRLRSLAFAAVLLVALSACRSNDAPVAEPAYDGRLHVTFVTPGAGSVASTRTKWQVEPAPTTSLPIEQRTEAARRSHSSAVELGGTSTRVYFGLFTGLDAAGGAHVQTPAWLVIARNVPVGKTKQFGVIAFSDDLTQPWVSSRLTSAAKPVAY